MHETTTDSFSHTHGTGADSSHTHGTGTDTLADTLYGTGSLVVDLPNSDGAPAPFLNARARRRVDQCWKLAVSLSVVAMAVLILLLLFTPSRFRHPLH